MPRVPSGIQAIRTKSGFTYRARYIVPGTRKQLPSKCRATPEEAAADHAEMVKRKATAPSHIPTLADAMKLVLAWCDDDKTTHICCSPIDSERMKEWMSAARLALNQPEARATFAALWTRD